jgi:hypothetical protein
MSHFRVVLVTHPAIVNVVESEREVLWERNRAEFPEFIDRNKSIDRFCSVLDALFRRNRLRAEMTITKRPWPRLAFCQGANLKHCATRHAGLKRREVGFLPLLLKVTKFFWTISKPLHKALVSLTKPGGTPLALPMPRSPFGDLTRVKSSIRIRGLTGDNKTRSGHQGKSSKLAFE